MKRISIRPATLSAIGEALSAAHAALMFDAQQEESESREGVAVKACDAIRKAQLMLARDTRPEAQS